MAAATTDEIQDLATELGAGSDADAAVARLIEAAGGDKAIIEAARDQVARALHGNAGDWTATGALTLLNKTLVSMGWYDKYDWKIRWSQRFRRP
jgi:glutamate/tyrosine decarboxylase-like PLP-dependent enzyme